MAAIPVYMLSLGARIAVIYLAYKAVEKLRREFWYPSSSAAYAAAGDTGVTVVPNRVPERDCYPSPSPSVAPAVTVHPVAIVVPDHVLERDWYHYSSSVAPAVTVDTVVYDREPSTEDVPDRVSSTEDAPVSVGSLEEEFQSEDVPDRVSSTEDAPVSMGSLEEEFQSVGLQDKNKGNVDGDDFKKDNIEWDSPVREAKPIKNLYSQNPDAVDCSNYLWTGISSNGSNCGYTHPPRKENQAQRSASSLESAQIIKEKEKEDLSEQKQQQECKYYLQPGGSKFGKACRYRHSRKKPVVPPPLDFNFLGLPIRPGKKECLDYMRVGSCKSGPNCRFHHPDPTAVGEGDVPSGSVSLHPSGASQPASTSWSSPPNKTVPYRDAANLYVPPILPPQGVHPSPEWNGFQGEKEFLYFKCDDSSKHGPNYRFHHPDPSCVSRGDVPFGSVSVQPSGASQPASTSWCSPPNGTVPYLDAANPYVPMMLPPQGVHPNPEWNGYQGERECLYYMRDGSCEYGPNYNFHHPDPIGVGGGDIPSGSISLHPSGASQPASTSWSSPPNETVPYLDAANPHVSLPYQGVHPNSKWNVHQASSRPNGTQPLFAANFNPLGWSKPKTQPAVNGTRSKDAKKNKIVQSARCEICKIDCKSKNVLDQHKLGKKHKENLEKLEESKKEASAPADIAALAAKDSMVGPKESPVANKGKTVGVKQGNEKGSTYVGPGEDLETLILQSAWCEICKFDCKSKNALDKHKFGKKHKNNLEKLEESKKEASAPAATVAPTAKDPMVGPKESPAANKGKTVGVKQGNEKGATSLGPGEDSETLILQSAWCEICKFDCKSQNVLDKHKFGKKHKNNLEKLEESKKEASAPAATVAPMAKDPMVGPKESPAANKGKTVGVKQGNEKGATSLGPGEDLETLILQSTWCEICKIDCKSKIVLDQHKFGKKHKNNLEKLEESNKEASDPATKDQVICPKESLAADKGKTVATGSYKSTNHKCTR